MSSYLKGLADKVNGVDKQSFAKELDINLLVPSQNNFYGIREIDELAESIKENGLMHNLVVRKKDDGIYEIISGERRYRALIKLGYKTVPCQVKENLSDLDTELMLIQANSEQRELTPSEKMEGIKRLNAIYEKKRANGEKLSGKTRDLIGKDLGLSGVQIGRYKKVDRDLIPELKEKLDKDEITLTQAHTISSLSKDEQKIIHDEIKDMNVKDHKEEVKTLVEGIKQPVESNLDKQLLNEIYPEEKKKNFFSEKYLKPAKKTVEISYVSSIREKINKMLIKYPRPNLIIKNSEMSIFYYGIQHVELDRQLRANIPGSAICIDVHRPKELKQLPISSEGIIFDGAAYKINADVYLYFSNYNEEMNRLYKRGLVEVTL